MDKKKILVTYFSVFPKKDKFTEKFAKVIADMTGAELVEILCASKYPEESVDYPKIEKIAYQERDSDARPAITNEIPILEYDMIFIV